MSGSSDWFFRALGRTCWRVVMIHAHTTKLVSTRLTLWKPSKCKKVAQCQLPASVLSGSVLFPCRNMSAAAAAASNADPVSSQCAERMLKFINYAWTPYHAVGMPPASPVAIRWLGPVGAPTICCSQTGLFMFCHLCMMLVAARPAIPTDYCALEAVRGVASYGAMSCGQDTSAL